MAMPRKPDPEKFCAHCGTLMERKRFKSGVLESLLHFGRRKFCNQACMAKAFDARPSTTTEWSTTHYHARKAIPLGPCERCGAPQAKDVHHRDHDHTNNDPKNLERICRSCHTKEHRTKTPCSVCGAPSKGRGFCNKHLIRWRKYGDPMATKIPPRQTCSVCGSLAHCKGLCGKHYMQAKRAGTLPS